MIDQGRVYDNNATDDGPWCMERDPLNGKCWEKMIGKRVTQKENCKIWRSSL